MMDTQMSQDDLAAVVEGAVSVLLGFDPGELTTATAPTSCTIGAAVHFTGDWQGAVVVACDSEYGKEAAAAMFGSAPDAVDDEEFGDALGELANVIAGNVKPLLPAPANLSLPILIQGADVHVGILGAHQCHGIVYRRGSSELSVRVFERSS
jgi:chemotaxis protein CheX